LVPHIETTDSLLVVKVVPHEFQGWLPTAAWQWLSAVSDSGLPQLPFPPPPKLEK
jgi:hypothetical protein